LNSNNYSGIVIRSEYNYIFIVRPANYRSDVVGFNIDFIV